MFQSFPSRSSQSFGTFSSEAGFDQFGSGSIYNTTPGSSGGYPTPVTGNTRPSSETNSFIQSCSSALSGVSDRRLDELLGDGVNNQSISENQVTQLKDTKAGNFMASISPIVLSC